MVRLASVAVLLFATVAVAAPPPKPLAVDLKAQTEFAKALERSINEGDSKALKNLFDSDAFSVRIFKSVSIPDQFRKDFQGRIDTFGDSFFEQLLKKAPAHGCSMKLLRVRVVDGEPRALFRSLTEDGGVNYLDLVLPAPEKGKPVRIVDIHVAVSGEFLSQTVAVLMAKAHAALERDKGDTDELKATVQKLEAVVRFTSLARSGKTKEALAAYEKLPAEYKQEKAIMLAYVLTAAGQLDEDPDAYERAIDAFVKKFPTDPAAELLSLDGYILRKKYAEFRKGVDRLDKIIGGDPYLHVMRAVAFRLEGKVKEAKAAINRAIAAEPELTPAYMGLADIALEEKDFKELARLLTVLETRLSMDFSAVSTADEYAEFRKSPDYETWWKARKNK